MIRDESPAYYLKREQEARALAAAASEAGIRGIHLTMAAEYSRRAQKLLVVPPSLPTAA